MQFGYNSDYVGVLPLPGRRRALLVVNHEYTNEELMFPAGVYDEDDRSRRIAMAVTRHVRGRDPARTAGPAAPGGRWRSRTTPVQPSHHRLDAEFGSPGPRPATPRLRTTADPTGRSVLGTLNNCAGGMTPLGHRAVGRGELQPVLRAEQHSPPGGATTPLYARYGISEDSTAGNWKATSTPAST